MKCAALQNIWSSWITSACISTQQLAIWGILPQKLFAFRDHEIVSETIFGSKQWLPHAWITTFPAHHVVEHWFRHPNCLLISKTTLAFADEGCETNPSLEEPKLLEGRLRRLRGPFIRFAVRWQVSTCGISHANTLTVCVLALWRCLMSNGVNWWHQASHAWVRKEVVQLKPD